MPDILLYILAFLWVITVIGFIADTGEPLLGIVGFLPIILVVMWVSTAWEENSKTPHVYGTYKAVDVDGTMTLNVNGHLINLNEKLNRNVAEGEEFEVFTYQGLDKGIYFLLTDPYKIKSK